MLQFYHTSNILFCKSFTEPIEYVSNISNVKMRMKYNKKAYWNFMKLLYFYHVCLLAFASSKKKKIPKKGLLTDFKLFFLLLLRKNFIFSANQIKWTGSFYIKWQSAKWNRKWRERYFNELSLNKGSYRVGCKIVNCQKMIHFTSLQLYMTRQIIRKIMKFRMLTQW